MYSQESSELLARITVNPDVMVGKPVIRGMRITAEDLRLRLRAVPVTGKTRRWQKNRGSVPN
jgi:hypothetical protein